MISYVNVFDNIIYLHGQYTNGIFIPSPQKDDKKLKVGNTAKSSIYSEFSACVYNMVRVRVISVTTLHDVNEPFLVCRMLTWTISPPIRVYPLMSVDLYSQECEIRLGELSSGI